MTQQFKLTEPVPGALTTQDGRLIDVWRLAPNEQSVPPPTMTRQIVEQMNARERWEAAHRAETTRAQASQVYVPAFLQVHSFEVESAIA